ncbi:MAG: prolipoprotein diacylglyceryl transferase [Candidatus Eisenbacteria bacterium]|jgi:phosphatidylglycerol:prolipoprotein diacylglycerol transferase|nr:prolipoprotein diacylglyceryl transferase [Candidatus Eisenbacteria bacterium]
MHPEILRIGPTPVYSYGLMLVISFALGILLASKRARERGLPAEAILDVATVILISAIVGSRLLYIVFHVSEFEGRWLDTINIFKGLTGLSMFGGIAMAIAASLVYMKAKRLPLWPMADALAPSYALGVGLTRIGCWLNGCCFGRLTDLPWAITFPQGCAASSVVGDAHVHPSQLYESLAGLLILLAALRFDRTRPASGMVTSLVFGLYGLARFGLDFFRLYEENNFVNVAGVRLASSQVFSLALVCLALAGMAVFSRRREG